MVEQNVFSQKVDWYKAKLNEISTKIEEWRHTKEISEKNHERQKGGLFGE